MGFILILVVGYFLYKYFTENKPFSDSFRKRQDPMDLLKERYAKGELDEEQYNRIKRNLRD